MTEGHLIDDYIAVNYNKSDKDDLVHFLTHIETDMRSEDLKELISVSAPTIFTSSVNAHILKIYFKYDRNIVPVEMGKSYQIYTKNRKMFIFTCLRSHYNCGSMVLIARGDFGTLIYTGFSAIDFNSLNVPIVKEIIRQRCLTKLYLDCTYYRNYLEFFSISDIKKVLVQFFRSRKNRFYIHVPIFGLEDLLGHVAMILEELMVVDEKRMMLIQYLGLAQHFTLDKTQGRLHVISQGIMKRNNDDESSQLVYIKVVNELSHNSNSYMNHGKIHFFTIYPHCTNKDCSDIISNTQPDSLIPIGNLVPESHSNKSKKSDPVHNGSLSSQNVTTESVKIKPSTCDFKKSMTSPKGKASDIVTESNQDLEGGTKELNFRRITIRAGKMSNIDVQDDSCSNKTRRRSSDSLSGNDKYRISNFSSSVSPKKKILQIKSLRPGQSSVTFKRRAVDSGQLGEKLKQVISKINNKYFTEKSGCTNVEKTALGTLCISPSKQSFDIQSNEKLLISLKSNIDACNISSNEDIIENNLLNSETVMCDKNLDELQSASNDSINDYENSSTNLKSEFFKFIDHPYAMPSKQSVSIRSQGQINIRTNVSFKKNEKKAKRNIKMVKMSFDSVKMPFQVANISERNEITEQNSTSIKLPLNDDQETEQINLSSSFQNEDVAVSSQAGECTKNSSNMVATIAQESSNLVDIRKRNQHLLSEENGSEMTNATSVFQNNSKSLDRSDSVKKQINQGKPVTLVPFLQRTKPGPVQSLPILKTKVNFMELDKQKCRNQLKSPTPILVAESNSKKVIFLKKDEDLNEKGKCFSNSSAPINEQDISGDSFDSEKILDDTAVKVLNIKKNCPRSTLMQEHAETDNTSFGASRLEGIAEKTKGFLEDGSQIIEDSEETISVTSEHSSFEIGSPCADIKSQKQGIVKSSNAAGFDDLNNSFQSNGDSVREVDNETVIPEIPESTVDEGVIQEAGGKRLGLVEGVPDGSTNVKKNTKPIMTPIKPTPNDFTSSANQIIADGLILDAQSKGANIFSEKAIKMQDPLIAKNNEVCDSRELNRHKTLIKSTDNQTFCSVQVEPNQENFSGAIPDCVSMDVEPDNPKTKLQPSSTSSGSSVLFHLEKRGTVSRFENAQKIKDSPTLKPKSFVNDISNAKMIVIGSREAEEYLNTKVGNQSVKEKPSIPISDKKTIPSNMKVVFEKNKNVGDSSEQVPPLLISSRSSVSEPNNSLSFRAELTDMRNYPLPHLTPVQRTQSHIPKVSLPSTSSSSMSLSSNQVLKLRVAPPSTVAKISHQNIPTLKKMACESSSSFNISNQSVYLTGNSLIIPSSLVRSQPSESDSTSSKAPVNTPSSTTKGVKYIRVSKNKLSNLIASLKSHLNDSSHYKIDDKIKSQNDTLNIGDRTIVELCEDSQDSSFKQLAHNAVKNEVIVPLENSSKGSLKDDASKEIIYEQGEKSPCPKLVTASRLKVKNLSELLTDPTLAEKMTSNSLVEETQNKKFGKTVENVEEQTYGNVSFINSEQLNENNEVTGRYEPPDIEVDDLNSSKESLENSLLPKVAGSRRKGKRKKSVWLKNISPKKKAYKWKNAEYKNSIDVDKTFSTSIAESNKAMKQSKALDSNTSTWLSALNKSIDNDCGSVFDYCKELDSNVPDNSKKLCKPNIEIHQYREGLYRNSCSISDLRNLKRTELEQDLLNKFGIKNELIVQTERDIERSGYKFDNINNCFVLKRETLKRVGNKEKNKDEATHSNRKKCNSVKLDSVEVLSSRLEHGGAFQPCSASTPPPLLGPFNEDCKSSGDSSDSDSIPALVYYDSIRRRPDSTPGVSQPVLKKLLLKDGAKSVQDSQKFIKRSFKIILNNPMYTKASNPPAPYLVQRTESISPNELTETLTQPSVQTVTLQSKKKSHFNPIIKSAQSLSKNKMVEYSSSVGVVNCSQTQNKDFKKLKSSSSKLYSEINNDQAEYTFSSDSSNNFVDTELTLGINTKGIPNALNTQENLLINSESNDLEEETLMQSRSEGVEGILEPNIGERESLPVELINKSNSQVYLKKLVDKISSQPSEISSNQYTKAAPFLEKLLSDPSIKRAYQNVTTKHNLQAIEEGFVYIENATKSVDPKTCKEPAESELPQITNVVSLFNAACRKSSLNVVRRKSMSLSSKATASNIFTKKNSDKSFLSLLSEDLDSNKRSRKFIASGITGPVVKNKVKYSGLLRCSNRHGKTPPEPLSNNSFVLPCQTFKQAETNKQNFFANRKQTQRIEDDLISNQLHAELTELANEIFEGSTL